MERTWASPSSNRRVTLMFGVGGGTGVAAVVLFSTWWSLPPDAPERLTYLALAAAFGTACVLYVALALIQRIKNRPTSITITDQVLRLGQDGEETTLEFANIISADYLPSAQAVTVRLRTQPSGSSPSPSSAKTVLWARSIPLGSFDPAQRAEILSVLREQIERHGGVAGGHGR